MPRVPRFRRRSIEPSVLCGSPSGHMFGSIGLPELLIIAAIAVIILGHRRLMAFRGAPTFDFHDTAESTSVRSLFFQAGEATADLRYRHGVRGKGRLVTVVAALASFAFPFLGLYDIVVGIAATGSGG